MKSRQIFCIFIFSRQKFKTFFFCK